MKYDPQDRLSRISLCMDEINRCQREFPDLTGAEALLGYYDWLEALHYELHEETPRIGEIMLSTDKQKRKQTPLATGVLDYFPDALAEVAHVSFVGNEQHNPGTPLHWDRSKSTDEADALIRHFIERGTVDTDGLRHSAKVAWRALALLQKELEDASAA